MTEMVQIKKNGKLVTAICQRCKKAGVRVPLRRSLGKTTKTEGLRCPDCGWFMVPTEMIDPDVDLVERTEEVPLPPPEIPTPQEGDE